MFLVFFLKKNQDIDYIAVKVVDSNPRPGALLVVSVWVSNDRKKNPMILTVIVRLSMWPRNKLAACPGFNFSLSNDYWDWYQDTVTMTVQNSCMFI